MSLIENEEENDFQQAKPQIFLQKEQNGGFDSHTSGDIVDINKSTFPKFLSLNRGGEEKLKQKPSYSTKQKKIIVLDLDETLVHSFSRTIPAKYDFIVRALGEVFYVMKRPYVEFFLSVLSRLYEIHVYTTSLQIYADQILDLLDPSTKLISKRFYRDDCKVVDDAFTKDIGICQEDLSKVFLIDNSSKQGRLHRRNFIKIKGFYGESSDIELIRIISLLRVLSKVNDVRDVIDKIEN